MRKDTSFSDRKLTREEFSHKYWKDGKLPYQYHTAGIEDGRDEREQFLFNQCRALYELRFYDKRSMRSELRELKEDMEKTSLVRYRFILILLCLMILLIAVISVIEHKTRKPKKESPTAATEGDDVTEKYLRYLFGPEFGKD